MELIVVGCNFRSASLEEREAWLVSPQKKWSGAVYLATCNRVEIYAAAEAGRAAEALLQRWGIGQKPGYVRRGDAAFAHLVRVAAGLDSMVLGETEVMGQVKRAYQRALESGAASPLLNFTFQRAFAIAKKIRSETGISRLPVSVGSAGLLLLEQIFGDFRKVRAAVAGLGEMGRQTALGLVKKGVGNLTLFGRNLEKANDFARQLAMPVEIAPLETLAERLPTLDLLVTASRKPGYLVEAARYQPDGRLQVFLDLGVPRNLDPELGKSENLFLYNVDDLKEIAAQNLASRRAEAEEAEVMIQKEILVFQREWRRKTQRLYVDLPFALENPKL